MDAWLEICHQISNGIAQSATWKRGRIGTTTNVFDMAFQHPLPTFGADVPLTIMIAPRYAHALGHLLGLMNEREAA